MFGDVGGLRDFIGIFFTACFGFFSEKFFNASIVESLFHVSDGKNRPPAKMLASIRPLKFTTGFTLINAFTLGKCSGDRKRRKALEKGLNELDRHLDVIKLVRQNRVFTTLLRLLLHKQERRLIRFQRRECILEDRKMMSSEEDYPDSVLLQMIRREQNNLLQSDQPFTFLDKLKRGVTQRDWKAPA